MLIHSIRFRWKDGMQEKDKAMHARKVAANSNWAQLFGAIPAIRIGV